MAGVVKYMIKNLLSENYIISDNEEDRNNEYFMGVSLINDFNYTMSKIKEWNLDFGFEDEDFAEFVHEKLIDRLIIGKYVLDEHSIDYIKMVPEILTISLNNDFKKTKALFPLLIEKIINDETFLESFDLFEIESLQKIMENPNNEPLAFARLMEQKVNIVEDKQQVAKEIVGECNRTHFPLNCLTKKTIMSTGFLTEIYGNEVTENFLVNYIGGAFPYTDRQEANLLKLLSPKSKNLEEYILKIKDKKRDDLSLIEMFGIEYYAKKVLYLNGVQKGYNINLYEPKSGSEQGYHSTDGNIAVHNSGKDQSVEDIVLALHHECSHAVMYSLIENKKIEDTIEIDEELDIYYKDVILKDLLGEDYYSDNYHSISYEFDAQFRSLCMQAKLFDEEEKLNFNVKELYERAQKRVVDKASSEIADYYDRDLTRYHNHSIYDINQLFIEIFSKVDYNFAIKCYNKYPIFKYDLDVKFDPDKQTFKVERKSINELVKAVEDAIMMGNEKDKQVYLKLLERRCDRRIEISSFVCRLDEYRNAVYEIHSKDNTPEWAIELMEKIKENAYLDSMVVKKYSNDTSVKEKKDNIAKGKR